MVVNFEVNHFDETQALFLLLPAKRPVLLILYLRTAKKKKRSVVQLCCSGAARWNVVGEQPGVTQTTWYPRKTVGAWNTNHMNVTRVG